ncbi:GpE family phage tail protein [Acinetobacter bereziniae]|nr:GpE family phage tail protein [Acinetobacter bereziniae]MCU4317111.1 GpE family phage tail protein [Acinetobacter bereziniae]
MTFHWSIRDYEDMTISELMMWHQKAVERNQSEK